MYHHLYPAGKGTTPQTLPIRKPLPLRTFLICGSLAFVAPVLATPALAQTAPTAAAPKAREADGDNDDQPTASSDIVVTGRRLDALRDSIQPSIGANDTRISRAALDAQPGGADRALNAVLLQAPGVTQDTDGDNEIHIRNEHGNVQYRLNGVIIPDSISGFGPLIDTRIASSVEVLTGALPAQYGERTAGVVQLNTMSGSFDADGDIGVYGGAYGTIQPSATYRNSFGRLNVFFSGSYLRSDLGLAAPTADRTVLHDRTEQEHGFGYLSYLIDDASRISLFGGTSIGQFQIPNTPDVTPPYPLNGRTTFDSATLDQNQKQQTHFGVLAYQLSKGNFDLQVAPFVRYAHAHFLPDPNGGELMFTGGDGELTQTNLAWGAQADASYKAGSSHTLRFGLYFQRERSTSDSSNRVFPVNDTDPANIFPTSDVPTIIPVSQTAHATTIAAYLQDEWKLADNLTLNLGLRYDRFHWNLTEDQLSPRAGLVWKPTTSTTIHAGYARNFTPPPLALIGTGALAAFQHTTGAAEVTTADPVRVEREHMFDIGAQHVIGGRLTLGIDAYYKIKRNLLDDSQFGTTELLAPFNYAKGHNWGVELSAAYEHGPISAYANVARGDQKATQIVSNQFLVSAEDLAYIANHEIYTDHSQKWTASAGASAHIPDGLGELQPSVEAIYGSGLRRTLGRTLAGPNPIPNGATQQAYVQVNLGLAQQIGRNKEKGLTIRVDVTNLFDKVYLVHDGSGVGAGQPQFGPRRAVYFGIRKAF